MYPQGDARAHGCACLSEQKLLDFGCGHVEGHTLEEAAQHTDACQTCWHRLCDAARALGGDDGGLSPWVERTFVPGSQLGRYRILARVGAGGMGVVYAAHDQELERKVALKVLHRRGPDDDAMLLRQEARALARLSHPNVVAVHDVGEFEGTVFAIMEFVDGLTLRAWCEASPRSWSEVLHTFIAAGQGLLAAHRAGLVHRDFKPDNVLVSEGRVRVADFGMAGPAGADFDGRIMGTPGYMAPEQRTHEPATAATDQYAFALSLWEALSGVRPGPVADQGPALPSLPRVPVALFRALRRALCKSPEARYPAMDALLEALSAVPPTSS